MRACLALCLVLLMVGCGWLGGSNAGTDTGNPVLVAQMLSPEGGPLGQVSVQAYVQETNGDWRKADSANSDSDGVVKLDLPRPSHVNLVALWNDSLGGAGEFGISEGTDSLFLELEPLAVFSWVGIPGASVLFEASGIQVDAGSVAKVPSGPWVLRYLEPVGENGGSLDTLEPLQVQIAGKDVSANPYSGLYAAAKWLDSMDIGVSGYAQWHTFLTDELSAGVMGYYCEINGFDLSDCSEPNDCVRWQWTSDWETTTDSTQQLDVVVITGSDQFKCGVLLGGTDAVEFFVPIQDARKRQ